MKLSIVIPNYNGAALLKANLSSVHQALDTFQRDTGESGEIIVSDDASSDESKDIISKMTFPVRFIEHLQNTGFSGNVNRGVKEAKGELIVLLNTDVQPKKDFLLPLTAHFAAEKVFAVGCMDESIEQGKTKLRGRGIGKWEKGFLHHRAGNLGGRYTLWASGGSSAFRKNLWERFGGMDELFNPFYWEDIDLSYRAWKAGYEVLFEKKSVVRHEHEAGTIRTNFTSRHVKNTAYRNQFLFVWKNASGWLLIKHICWLPYHLIHAILRGDTSFLLGLIAAIQRLPRLKRSMKHVRSDSEIIKMSST